MFNFFVSLYLAILRGRWQQLTTAGSGLTKIINNLANWLMNLFGGSFETLQTLSVLDGVGTAVGLSGEDGYIVISILFALITISGICFAVWKIVKSLFFIFFEGWR